MAGSVQHRLRDKSGTYRPKAEINVTPFVDVMLVLLVVFMVAAPLLTVGVPVDLPQSKAQPLPQDSKPLEVTVNAKGKIFLQKTEISLDDLVPKLEAISKNAKDTRIYVRGDEKIDYGLVMQVMGTINAAGFNKVALVTQPIKTRTK
ncbi:MAG TPA: protein TolR [Alphaproteobacteria bacterium]|nr:protein TolR [Alphaproteobacteria bacterium]